MLLKTGVSIVTLALVSVTSACGNSKSSKKVESPKVSEEGNGTQVSPSKDEVGTKDETVGGSVGNQGGAPVVEEDKHSLAYCEKAWKKHRDQNPIGSFYKLKTTTRFKSNNQESVSTVKVTVKSNEEEQIFNTIATEATSSEYPYKKVDFVEGCMKADDETEQERGTEKVTVPAGTFDTKWVLYIIKDADGKETKSKFHFVEDKYGSEQLVKSITENEMMLSTSELVESNRLK
jgi:hypothetical protein